MRGLAWNILPALFLALLGSIHGDPTNLVSNGDFEWEYFYFSADTIFDVSHDGMMQRIPFYTVVRGGVQILDALEYDPPVSITGDNGIYLIHMNHGKGPGVLQSDPIATPRKGAKYNLSFDLADNPDGGPLYKTITVKVLVNNRVSSRKSNSFIVSAPYSTHQNIAWSRMSFTFIGTGEATILQFESQVPGMFGPLIDNVRVTLVSLVDNGSFETIASGFVQDNVTACNVISSPSSVTPGWTVTTGKIKLCTNQLVQGSTDSTTHMLDLNADFSSGTISSDPFTTRRGKKYRLLFDTAANPNNIPALKGSILASVLSNPGGASLASRSVFVDGEGFNMYSVGWMTFVVEFKARGTRTVVEFMSQMTDSFNGPVLDNVAVYEIFKPAHHKSLGSSFSAGTPLRPSLWTVVLAGVLEICAFRHLICEILSLHY